MADYSTTLKTQYLEARSHIKNRQSEFRFDKNTIYTPNIRLVNVGLRRPAGSGSADEYNPQSGVLACIKAMRLMDGSRELTSSRHSYLWTAFKNINANNEQMTDIRDRLHKSTQGVTLGPSGEVLKTNDTMSLIQVEGTAQADGSDLGYVDLRILLPLLSTLPALDTKVFPNLRLVVEWENNPLLVTKAKQVVDVVQPTLVVDEVVGDAKAQMLRKASMGSFVWNEIEHDQFNVPTGVNAGATDSEVEQKVARVVNGFDNKYLGRVLMVKSFTDKTKMSGTNDGSNPFMLGNGNACSQAQFKEVVQLRVGGANIFPADGLKNDAFKSMLLQETWGVSFCPPFGNVSQCGSDNDASVMLNVNGVLEGFGSTPSNFQQSMQVGQYAYIGFSVEDRVKQLQFTYSRSVVVENGAGDNSQLKRSQNALDIHLYGEISKSLKISNAGYEISYM